MLKRRIAALLCAGLVLSAAPHTLYAEEFTEYTEEIPADAEEIAEPADRTEESTEKEEESYNNEEDAIEDDITEYDSPDDTEYDEIVEEISEDSAEPDFAGTYADATEISVNTDVTGRLDTYGNVDWYRFTTDADGAISLKMSQDCTDSGTVCRVVIYDFTGEKKYNSYYYSGNGTVTHAERRIGIPAGTYYVKVYSDTYTSFNYTMSINFENEDIWEREFNNTYTAANEINVNTDVKATSISSSDNDWFYFDTPTDGNISVSFWNDRSRIASSVAQVYIYDSTGTVELYKRWFYGDDGITHTTLPLGLSAGRYYILVDPDSDPFDYAVKVNFTESDVWETEKNNTLNTADTIPIGTKVYGSMLPYEDTDWYKLIMPVSGDISLALEHDETTTGTNTLNAVLYDEGCTNKLLNEFYNGYVSIPQTSKSVSVSAGTYYLRISGSYTELCYNFNIQYAISSIEIKKDSIPAKLYTGQTAKLEYLLKPDIKDIVTWESSRPDIASVDENGQITAKNAGKTVITVTTSNKKTATCNLTVIPKGYTVKFDANDATGTMKDLACIYGTAKPLTANTFKKAGYVFKEWNTDKDGSGTSYPDKQKVSTLSDEPGGIVTLYAQWKPIEYAITYKVKNKGLAIDFSDKELYPDVYTAQTNLTFTKPEKPGYTFEGWYTAANCAPNTIITDTEGLSKKLQVYAKFKGLPYTVKFDANGGVLINGKKPMTDINAEFGTAKATTANRFKRPGYKFMGWNTDKDSKEILYKNSAKISGILDKDTNEIMPEVTLYAVWNPVKYKIMYNGASGKTITNENPAKYTVENLFELQDPVKTGYVFKGWYRDKKFTEKITAVPADVSNPKNLTVYAKWEKQ